MSRGLIVRLLVAVLLLVWVAGGVDWSRFLEVTRGVDPLWLVPVLLVAALDRLWMAGKWLYLLRGIGVPARFRETMAHYLYGGLVGIAVQFHLAGDISRAIGLGARLGRPRAVLASVAFERVAGVATSGLQTTAALGVLWASGVLGPWKPLVPVVAALTLLAGIGPFALFSRPARRLLGWCRSRLGERVGERLEGLATMTERLAGLRRVMAGFSLLTLAEQFVPLAIFWLLARSFDLDLGVEDVFMTVPVIMFFSRLPVSVQALGVQEGLSVLLLGMLGMSASESFAIALAYRVVDMVVIGLGALLFSVRQRERATQSSNSPTL